MNYVFGGHYRKCGLFSFIKMDFHLQKTIIVCILFFGWERTQKSIWKSERFLIPLFIRKGEQNKIEREQSKKRQRTTLTATRLDYRAHWKNKQNQYQHKSRLRRKDTMRRTMNRFVGPNMLGACTLSCKNAGATINPVEKCENKHRERERVDNVVKTANQSKGKQNRIEKYQLIYRSY